MKVSLKVEYACRVLIQLAGWHGREEWPHIDTLAAIEEIPANYLVQILNDLRAAGIVNSRRGKQGGYILARAPADISLLQIVCAIDGELLGFSESAKGASGRHVAMTWASLAAVLEAKARSISLQEMQNMDNQSMWHI